MEINKNLPLRRYIASLRAEGQESAESRREVVETAICRNRFYKVEVGSILRTLVSIYHLGRGWPEATNKAILEDKLFSIRLARSYGKMMENDTYTKTGRHIRQTDPKIMDLV